MTTPVPITGHPVSFDGVILRRARFDDLGKNTLPGEQRKRLNVQLELSTGTLQDPHHAYVRLGLKATPAEDPELFGELDVVMDALFSIDTKAEPASLMAFCRTSGPSLLMPYLRQAITNLTAFTRGGIIIIPPINMMKLVADEAGTKTQAVAEAKAQ